MSGNEFHQLEAWWQKNFWMVSVIDNNNNALIIIMLETIPIKTVAHFLQ